jgi:DNA-3-methyladenine glycosylase I
MKAMAGVGIAPHLATVVTAADGVTRCRWATETGRDLTEYHDREWGRPTHDDATLFEVLVLTYFENGLSWGIVFDKRDDLRAAFHRFDPLAVAAMTPGDVDRLMADTSIIRNRRKIEATIHNAGLLSTHSLSELARRHEPREHHRLRSWADGRMSEPGVLTAVQSVAGVSISNGRPGRRPLVHADRRHRERSFRWLLPGGCFLVS